MGEPAALSTATRATRIEREDLGAADGLGPSTFSSAQSGRRVTVQPSPASAAAVASANRPSSATARDGADVQRPARDEARRLDRRRS